MLAAIIAVVVLLPSGMRAGSYSALWKNYTQAERKDLPKTQLTILGHIVKKATAAADYGQLIKAQLLRAKVSSMVSQDSLRPMVMSIETDLAKARQDSNQVLAAVYASVLGHIYTTNSSLGDSAKAVGEGYYRESMANPELLATVEAKGYEPLIIEGSDSRIFYDDLLHVIGFEAGEYKAMHDLYEANGNRAAACICAYYDLQRGRRDDVMEVRKSRYLHTIDSLIAVYGDLREAGELAIERYNFMTGAEDASAEDRYRYINYALSRWASWPRMNILRNAQKQLTLPSYNAWFGPDGGESDGRLRDEQLTPGKLRYLYLRQIVNLHDISMQVYRLKTDSCCRLNPDRKADLKKLMDMADWSTPWCGGVRNYIGLPEWKVINDSMEVGSVETGGLPKGAYLMRITATDKTGKAIPPRWIVFNVSNVYAFSQRMSKDRLRICVANATTGEPLPGAKVRLTGGRGYDNGQYTETLTCDGGGEVTVAVGKKAPWAIYAYTDSDKFCPTSRLAVGSSYSYSGKTIHEGRLYTDRAVYRPGQQVEAAVVCWTLDEETDETKAEAGRKVVIRLRNANWRVVATDTVTTDEWGMGHTVFTLPSQGLTGTFTIETDSRTGTRFRVEEYKRPTFEVTMDGYDGQYHDGDTITLTGQARTYGGVAVQNARVKAVTVTRPALWWYRQGRGYGNGSQTREDSTTTDADGRFSLRVPMNLLGGGKTRGAIYNNVNVDVDVTSSMGETRHGAVSLPLSNRESFLECDVPKIVENDSLKAVRFSYKNIAGREIAGRVSFTVDGHAYEGDANTPLPIQPLESGKHSLKAVCGADTINVAFTTFSVSDPKPAVETRDWFYVSANSFPAGGHPVYVQVGSSDSINVAYSVFTTDSVLRQGHFTLNGSLHNESLTYKAEYGQGVRINYCWVKEGRFYSHSCTIAKPLPDKRIEMKWTTFRDKLTPGQKEQWTLHVTRPKGKLQPVQMLATLYDYSLDRIARHGWSFSLGFRRILPSWRWNGMELESRSVYSEESYRQLAERPLSFSHFDGSVWPVEIWNRYLFDGYTAYNSLGGRIAGMKQARVAETAAMADVAVESKALAPMAADAGSMGKEQQASALDAGASVSDSNGAAGGQVRENFSETAFFYPNLTADGKGNIDIKFTLPESVTSWRFLGLAHDKDMNYGLTEAIATASKAVMIQPNMPRFLRLGDRTALSATVSNTSEKAASGKVTMVLTDPSTGRQLLNAHKPFSVEPGKTAVVSFDIDTRGLGCGPGVYVCRMTAEGKKFSDGEQHWLPILTDREYITSTLPFSISKAGKTTIDISGLHPAGTDAGYTVEYTDRPVWLAVQALPTVSTTDDKNAVSQAAAYYANRLASDIMHRDDNIRKVVEQWQKEQGEETSLMSALEKNQELKSVVLDETPWVTDADNEAGQKRQLINYFDESRLSYRLNNNLRNLRSLQNSDGSFSWWPGMRGNLYITTSVAKMLVRALRMTGTAGDGRQMADKAMLYLDKRMAKEVSDMKDMERKGAKNLMPSEAACDYLYISALAGRKVTADMRWLVDHLKNHTGQLTIYGKANSAVILAQYGEKAKAAEMLESVRQYLVYKEDMGYYFDTPKAEYSWRSYRIPTQTAAIEALAAVEPQQGDIVDGMQRWLLQAKRTQSWDTPIDCVNAVWAILLTHPASVGNTGGRMASLTVDSRAIDTSGATAGAGYVKARAGSNARELTIEKPAAEQSWGAVYAQYWQDAAEAETASSGISVKREIIGKPAVGAKVKVRITVEADRDYDFVQLQDKRPACLEPASQLSGYHWGYYCAPKDNVTNYYFDRMAKGRHVIETEYYIDRSGDYHSGLCRVECAYAPEYSGRAAAVSLRIEK